MGYCLELRPAGALGGGRTDARSIDDGGGRVCGGEGDDRIGVDLAWACAQAAVSGNRREADAGGGWAADGGAALVRVGGDRARDCNAGGLAVALAVWGQYRADGGSVGRRCGALARISDGGVQSSHAEYLHDRAGGGGMGRGEEDADGGKMPAK